MLKAIYWLTIGALLMNIGWLSALGLHCGREKFYDNRDSPTLAALASIQRQD